MAVPMVVRKLLAGVLASSHTHCLECRQLPQQEASQYNKAIDRDCLNANNRVF